MDVAEVALGGLLITCLLILEAIFGGRRQRLRMRDDRSSAGDSG